MRVRFHRAKSDRLRRMRGIGFEEAQFLFERPHFFDSIPGLPEQWRAVGWVDGRLWTVVYEEREDALGPHLHLVTLWKSTKQEQEEYGRHS